MFVFLLIELVGFCKKWTHLKITISITSRVFVFCVWMSQQYSIWDIVIIKWCVIFAVQITICDCITNNQNKTLINKRLDILSVYLHVKWPLTNIGELWTFKCVAIMLNWVYKGLCCTFFKYPSTLLLLGMFWLMVLLGLGLEWNLWNL